MGNTKEKILYASLRLFARDGYEGVSVSAIAGALGMTKGALYRHYASKRAIFETILARMEDADSRQAAGYHLPTVPRGADGGGYEDIALPQLMGFCRSQFRYWTQDSFAAAFRRMLTLEQYRSEELGRLYRQYLTTGPLGYTEDLLESLGIPDAATVAADLYGTMFFHYHLYDSAADKTAVTAGLERCLRRFEDRWGGER